MTLPGETLATGAPPVCEDCGTKFVLQVLCTNNYYIGTQCCCGPYSRESGYYGLREEAQRDLDSGEFFRP